MPDTVEKAARLLSIALFRPGRILLAPPSRNASCWRVFADGLSAEVQQHESVGVCAYTLKGPDGKILRRGAERDLRSALRQAINLLHETSHPSSRAAA